MSAAAPTLLTYTPARGSTSTLSAASASSPHPHAVCEANRPLPVGLQLTDDVTVADLFAVEYLQDLLQRARGHHAQLQAREAELGIQLERLRGSRRPGGADRPLGDGTDFPGDETEAYLDEPDQLVAGEYEREQVREASEEAMEHVHAIERDLARLHRGEAVTETPLPLD